MFLITLLLLIKCLQLYSFATIQSNKVISNICNNNFLDLYSDVIEEVTSPKQLDVIGTIPSYVRGLYIRNGPGLFGSIDNNKQNGRFTHIFDGIAKLVKYNINIDNNITFTTKFIKSNWYNNIIIKSKSIPPMFTAGPVVNTKISLLKKILTFNQVINFDNTPVSIHQIGDKNGPWVATTDAPVNIAFDPETLDTISKVTYKESIIPKGYTELASTSHPHKRFTDNNKVFTYNYLLALKVSPFNKSKPKSIAYMVRTDSSLNRVVVGTVPIYNDDIPYLHDFSVTNSYAILFIYPLYQDIGGNFNNKGFMSQMIWKGNAGVPTKIYVFDVKKFDNIDRNDINSLDSEAIAYYEAPPMFSYHHFNAYEENNNIIVDLSGYDNADIVNSKHGFLYFENMKNPELRKLEEREGRCYRYTLPLPNKESINSNNPIKVSPQILSAIDVNGNEYTLDLMRINPNFSTKKHRYSYSYTGFASPDKPYFGEYLDWGIIKLDHQLAEQISTGVLSNSSTCILWKEDNAYPTEPQFIPNPQGIDEDDGVVLIQVYDTNKQQTYLLVLDAKNMTEIARAYTNFKVPMTFHGDFIPHE